MMTADGILWMFLGGEHGAEIYRGHVYDVAHKKNSNTT